MCIYIYIYGSTQNSQKCRRRHYQAICKALRRHREDGLTLVLGVFALAPQCLANRPRLGLTLNPRLVNPGAWGLRFNRINVSWWLPVYKSKQHS